MTDKALYQIKEKKSIMLTRSLSYLAAMVFFFVGSYYVFVNNKMDENIFFALFLLFTSFIIASTPRFVRSVTEPTVKFFPDYIVISAFKNTLMKNDITINIMNDEIIFSAHNFNAFPPATKAFLNINYSLTRNDNFLTLKHFELENNQEEIKSFIE